MRISNNMMVKKYRKSLNNSLDTLTQLQNKVSSGRNFDKFSQDPINAMRANNLHHNYSAIKNYQSNVSSAADQLTTAEGAIMDIHTAVDEALHIDGLQGITGTAGKDERMIIATKLDTVLSSIVQTLNTKHADVYVFGGLNTSDAPFSVSENGDLLFRGINVDTGKLENEDGAISYAGKAKVSFGKANGDVFNGYTLSVTNDNTQPYNQAVVDADNKTITVNLSAGSTSGDLQTVLSDTANITFTGADTTEIQSADFSLITVDDATVTLAQSTSSVTNTIDLSEVANEKFFIDIGVGLKFNADNTVDSQSALDISTNGLKFLGYGVDNDGKPNNVFSLVKQLKEGLAADDFNYDEVNSVMTKLDSSNTDNVLSQITRLGVQSGYIERMSNRFEDNELNTETKLGLVENCDQVEAITDMTMQNYAYRATLQMGSNILQSTLLDYLS